MVIVREGDVMKSPWNYRLNPSELGGMADVGFPRPTFHLRGWVTHLSP